MPSPSLLVGVTHGTRNRPPFGRFAGSSGVYRDVATDFGANSRSFRARLNWLRAGVLGANDGIISVAAVVVGVAAAGSSSGAILIAGIAAILAGAVSMGIGEYVSVSSQRDTERALIAKQRDALAAAPADELASLAAAYREKGLSPATAQHVADELSAHDALGANLEARLHISVHEVSRPWQAAAASAVSFLTGALLPLAAIVLPSPEVRIPVTFGAVVVALALTGWLSAWIGSAPRLRATIRITLGGGAALLATWLVGLLLGSAGF